MLTTKLDIWLDQEYYSPFLEEGGGGGGGGGGVGLKKGFLEAKSSLKRKKQEKLVLEE